MPALLECVQCADEVSQTETTPKYTGVRSKLTERDGVQWYGQLKTRVDGTPTELTGPMESTPDAAARWRDSAAVAIIGKYVARTHISSRHLTPIDSLSCQQVPHDRWELPAKGWQDASRMELGLPNSSSSCLDCLVGVAGRPARTS